MILEHVSHAGKTALVTGSSRGLGPCSAMGGATYLEAMKAPLPQIDLMPIGEVTLETTVDILKAGAFALGIGGDLVDDSMVKRPSLV